MVIECIDLQATINSSSVENTGLDDSEGSGGTEALSAEQRDPLQSPTAGDKDEENGSSSETPDPSAPELTDVNCGDQAEGGSSSPLPTTRGRKRKAAASPAESAAPPPKRVWRFHLQLS